MEIPKNYYQTKTVHHTLNHDPDNGILSCGFLIKQSGSGNDHDICFRHYGALLLLNGTGEYTDHSGRHIRLTPGAFVQRLPGVTHTTTVDPDCKWLEFFVCFGKELYQVMENLGLMRSQPVLFPGLSEQLIQNCGILMEQFQKAPENDLTALFLEVQKFILNITRMSKEEHFGPMRRTLSQGAAFLCTPAPNYPTPEETAEHLGLKYETFRKYFKSAFSCPPAAYQLRYRLNLSRQLLLDSQYSIQEIALRCHFADVFAFSKAFRKLYGLSPRQFRALYL